MSLALVVRKDVRGRIGLRVCFWQTGYRIALCTRRLERERGLTVHCSVPDLPKGAKALYLLDFDGSNLPGLKEKIAMDYPGVHVRLRLPYRRFARLG